MTSNATLLSRRELELAGLVEHRLLRPLDERDKKRWLFVTQAVENLLTGKKNPPAQFPCPAADVVIGRFCKGLIVSVTAKRTGKADLKRLSDLDEAWSMTFPGPGAGWRLFGRFARRNVFVGLRCHPRGDCAPGWRYDQRANDMIGDWAARFASEPLRKTRYEDYLGQVFFDKDEV